MPASAQKRGIPVGIPLSYSKRPLSSNFIRIDKGEALGCRAQSTRPAAQRKFRLGFPVFFPSYPQRRRVAFEGAEALGYRGQSSQTKSRAADGSTGRSRGNGQRESRLGFPSFLFEKAAFFQFYPQRQGRSPWMPRAIHPACRAEEIPVGIPRFLPALSATPACRFRGRLKPLDAARNPPSRNPVLPTAARDEAEATGSGNPRFFLAEVRVDLAALKVARLQVRMRLCDALRQEAHALALAAHVAADQHRLGEP